MLLRLAKPSTVLRRLTTTLHHHHHNHPFSTTANTDDNWNDAWETAWLPTDTATTTTPWDPPPPLPADVDPDTSAFIADMNDNWDHRRRRRKPNTSNGIVTTNAGEEQKAAETETETETESGLCRLERVKRDYRVRKQRIHAGLWVNEIQKLHESQLGVPNDIDYLLHSCSQIFDSAGNHVNDLKVSSTSEFKNKPDGWESMPKSEDGSVWEMSQREEDILLQEFERRLAFCKFQIASFIKTHIFSRRRPIDGWKYMIEVIGPNAKKGKGSVSRLPSLADPATQAFTEDREPTAAGGARGRLTSPRRR